MTTLNRREFAIKVAAGVLKRADAAISQWRPEYAETDAQFQDRALLFVTTLVVNAYQGAMDGEFDQEAKQKLELIQ